MSNCECKHECTCKNTCYNGLDGTSVVAGLYKAKTTVPNLGWQVMFDCQLNATEKPQLLKNGDGYTFIMYAKSDDNSSTQGVRMRINGAILTAFPFPDSNQHKFVFDIIRLSDEKISFGVVQVGVSYMDTYYATIDVESLSEGNILDIKMEALENGGAKQVTIKLINCTLSIN